MEPTAPAAPGLDQQQWGRLVARTTEASAATVASAGTVDWSVPAEGLGWTASATAEHLASCLVGYAGQLTAPRPEGWVPLLTVLEDAPPSEGIGAVLLATGGILAAVVATAPASTTSYHPYGTAGPRDFAAMGIIETAVHTDDLARTFGLPWAPDPEACAAALAQVFPDVDPDGDPWAALQWACGRIALPGREQRGRWRWANTGT